MNNPTAVKKMLEPEKTELTSIMAANTHKTYAAPIKNTRAVSMFSSSKYNPRFAHTLHVESGNAKRGRADRSWFHLTKELTCYNISRCAEMLHDSGIPPTYDGGEMHIGAILMKFGRLRQRGRVHNTF